MSYYGDRPVGSIWWFDFNTSVNGVPTSLLGSPSLSCYKNSTTESTAGLTLTVDYDGKTGMNHVVVDMTADATFYAAGNDFSVQIAAGTIGGQSVANVECGAFSSSTEQTNINKTANSIARGTLTTGGSTTSLPTSAFQIGGVAASGVVANQFVNRTVLFDANTTTAGLQGASAAISASSASNTPTLTVGTLPASPVSGDTFSVV